MYEDQSSAGSGIILLIFIILFLAVGGFAVRRSDENKRASKAKRFETSRLRNNPRLALTDTYVYLIKRKRFPGKDYGATYLKVGIGVEDRVRLQLKEPETELIRLYKFSNREDAFEIEQRTIRKWNTKIRGEISTWHTNPGSEYILYNDKHLKQALSILEESGGTRVDGISRSIDLPANPINSKNPVNTSNEDVPEVLKRTQIYLMQSYTHKLIKVGIGNFNRPDNLKNSAWKIQRFGFFRTREMARAAEKRVLKHWRIDLKQDAPPRAKEILRSGHTETVDDHVGFISAWEIITKSEGFIPNLSDEDLKLYSEYQELLKRGKALWKDEAGWKKVEGSLLVMRYTYLANMVFYGKTGYAGLGKPETRELTRKMSKYLSEFQKFMNTNIDSLERVEKMSRWLPK